jgi:hypothetical protein
MCAMTRRFGRNDSPPTPVGKQVVAYRPAQKTLPKKIFCSLNRLSDLPKYGLQAAPRLTIRFNWFKRVVRGLPECSSVSLPL